MIQRLPLLFVSLIFMDVCIHTHYVLYKRKKKSALCATVYL